MMKVKVKGGDYTYEGWIVAMFNKRSGAVRYVVEDANGRLFIHNGEQILFDQPLMDVDQDDGD